MSALLVLIGISLVVAIGFLIAFIKAVKHGQYEDEDQGRTEQNFANGIKTEERDGAHKSDPGQIPL